MGLSTLRGRGSYVCERRTKKTTTITISTKYYYYSLLLLLLQLLQLLLILLPVLRLLLPPPVEDDRPFMTGGLIEEFKGGSQMQGAIERFKTKNKFICDIAY